MTTLQEKIEKKIEEGFESIHGAIHMKVGESKMLCPSISVFHQDLSTRAKSLVCLVEECEDELRKFLALKPAEPEKDPKGQLHLTVEFDPTAEPKAVDEDAPIDVEFTEAALPAHDSKAEVEAEVIRIIGHVPTYVKASPTMTIVDSKSPPYHGGMSNSTALLILRALPDKAGLVAMIESLKSGKAPHPEAPGRAPGEPAKRRGRAKSEEKVEEVSA